MQQVTNINKLLKFLFLFSFIIWFSFPSSAQNWEVSLLDNINPSQPNSGFWKTASSSVYPIAIALPTTILATGYLKKDKVLIRKGWNIVGSIVINTAITQGLKYVIKRERPYEKYPFIAPYQIETDPSFPSGHTSTAFATATSLSMQFKKWYIVVPAYTWASCVGYSRLYLGEHYPTDVIAGAAIGAGSALLSGWLNKKLFAAKK